MDAYFNCILIGFLYLDVGCQSNPRSTCIISAARDCCSAVAAASGAWGAAGGHMGDS